MRGFTTVPWPVRFQKGLDEMIVDFGLPENSAPALVHQYCREGIPSWSTTDVPFMSLCHVQLFQLR